MMKKFIDIKNIPKGEYPVLASGKTLVLDINYGVLKIFKKGDYNEKEVSIIKDVNSKYVISILDYKNENPYYILYEKVFPLKKCFSPFLKANLKLLKDISNALYHVHRKKYCHGDVAHGNIGLNLEGNYVLYDFEFAKVAETEEDFYNDVKMFLADFVIIFKGLGEKFENVYELYVILLEKLKAECEIEKEVKVNILGKVKTRKIVKINYDIKKFSDIVKNISKII